MRVFRLRRRVTASILGAAAALAFALAGPDARAAPRRYVLDAAASRIEIHVGKTGLFGFAGHEHQVVAGAFRGTAMLDPQRVAGDTLDLTVDAGALRVTGQGEPAGDVPQVQAAMLGPACLDAARFPTIHFVSTVVGDGGAHGTTGRDLMVRGDLTLHGATRPFTVRVSVDVAGDRLEATGQATLRQTDFGITPISKAGVVKVKDEVVIVWRIRGAAVGPGR
ncbi:MAG TPA: YceI family protein [Polyangia bacterium]|nr:YceI family protein [Polyangia bacterium]